MVLVDEGNCVTTLQLVWVFEPAVAPLLRHFNGNKDHFKGQVALCCISDRKIILQQSRLITFFFFFLLLSIPISVSYFIPSAVLSGSISTYWQNSSSHALFHSAALYRGGVGYL